MAQKVIKVDETLPEEAQQIQKDINKIYRKLNNANIAPEERQLLLDELREKKSALSKYTKKETNVVPVYNNSLLADHIAQNARHLYNTKFLI